MEHEKKYFAGWWLWVLLLLVISGTVFAAVGYAGLFSRTAVERIAFEHSYQRSEGIKQEIMIFEAAQAEIEAKLANPNLDPATRSNLEAEAAGIRVQLRAARARQ